MITEKDIPTYANSKKTHPLFQDFSAGGKPFPHAPGVRMNTTPESKRAYGLIGRSASEIANKQWPKKLREL